jgi:lambda repressor-like predicted transcriptional regulator
MKPTLIPTEIEDRRNRWPELAALDRADAVKRIAQESGKSIRSIARELGQADSSLRNLLVLANAPPTDRLLAQAGTISMRELRRRADARAKAEADNAKRGEQESRAKDSEKWSTRICAWLEGQNLAWTHQETIIQEVQRELMQAEIAGTLPKAEVPPGLTLEQIINRTRPNDSRWEQAIPMYFHIDWLAHWVLYAIPDAIVRDAALSIARYKTQLQEQPKNGDEKEDFRRK